MAAQSQQASDESTVVGVIHAVADSLRAWIAASWLADVGGALARTFAAATRDSALARGGRTLGRYVRHSVLYRWLTKEPEPDVVVIDLRETYAVGPFIALLDRVRPAVERSWRSAGVQRLSTGVTAAFRDAPVRAVSLAAAAAVLANTALVALDGSLSTAALPARVAALGLALAGTRVTTPWETLKESRAVRLLQAALEPPAPPEQRDRE